MKNRLISIGIIFALLIGMININALAKASEDFSEQSSFLIKLGVLAADGDLNRSTKIRRDRFTKEFTAFINRSEQVDITQKQQKSYYYDVSFDNEYLPYINYLTENGYVIGDDGDKFRPNDYITNMEMLKCVVAAVGYTATASTAQYPNGYLSVAGTLKLTNRLGALGDDATVESMVQLFYNALEVNVMERSVSEMGKFEINKDLTYLEKAFDISWIKGQLDGNYLTTLDAKASVMTEDNVTIDGEKYLLSEENKYLADYIGYKMKFYYRENGADKEIIAFVNDKTEELVVSAEQIDEYTDNRLYYTVGDESKQRKISINPNAVIMYNGVTLKSYSDDLLTSIPNGSIEFLRLDGESDYSIVKIYSYETYVVKSASADTNKIFAKQQRMKNPEYNPEEPTKNEEYLYEYPSFELDNYNHVFIRNATGMNMKLADLKENNVISVGESIDKTVIYINVETKAVSGTVDSMFENDEGKQCYEIAGAEYVLDDSFDKNMEFNVELKASVTAYLNYKGKIAFVTVNTASGEWMYGYLMNMVIDDVTDECIAKIFTASGKAESYRLKEKVRLDGASRKDKEVLSFFQSVPVSPESDENMVEPQLIRYQLNGEYISKIDSETVNIGGNETAETTLSLDRPFARYQFFWNTKQFVTGGNFPFNDYNTSVRADDNTLIFFVPDPNNEEIGYDAAHSDETLYSVKTGSGYFTNHESYDFGVYDVDYDNGALAKVFVSQAGESDKWEEDILISNIEHTIDEDDMPCIKIVGYNMGASTVSTYTLKSDVKTFENIINTSSSGSKPAHASLITAIDDAEIGLKKGDMIRIKTILGKVSKIRRYFSPKFINHFVEINGKPYDIIRDHGVIQADGTFMGTAGAATDTVMVGVLTNYSNGYVSFHNIDPAISMGLKQGTDARSRVPKRGGITVGIGNRAVYKYNVKSNKLEKIEKDALNEYLYSVNGKAYAYLYTNATELRSIVIYQE